MLANSALSALGPPRAVHRTTSSPVRSLARSSPSVPFPAAQVSNTGLSNGWQLRDFLELGALPTAVPCARLHTRQVLWEWGLAGLSESVELVTTELVTNAVTVSRSLEQMCPVRLWLLSDRERVLIVVWDADPRLPARIDDSDDFSESGRGLQLVEAVSTRWDAHAIPQAGGKVVRALCEQ